MLGVLGLLALLLALLLSSSCGILDPGEDPPREPAPGEVTVLFIGSSYLEFNNVPKRFEELSRKAGHSVYVRSYTIPGHPLAYHASSFQVTSLLRERSWDFVVLQGGGESVAYPRGAQHPVLPALRELHRKSTETSPTTRVIWMMPWAYEDGMLWVEGRTEDYAQMQLDIQERVLDWSDQVGLVIAPVGMAFYEVLTEWDPGLHFLHEEDWNHATPAGSFLAAATFFSTIFVESSSDLPYRWTVESGLAASLREVASRTVLESLDLWNIDWSAAGG